MMTTPGRALHNEILLACGKDDARLFRNNTGMGWTGDGQPERWPDGSIVLRNPRPFHAGLVKGSSDLIGWRSIEVTPAMVGRRLALFVAIEAKAGRDRLSAEQRHFIENIKRAGGLAGEAHSVTDAVAILRAIG